MSGTTAPRPSSAPNSITAERSALGEPTVVPEHSQLAALLVAHRLGRPPDGFTTRIGGHVETGITFDERVLSVPIATILELHFVLSGERLIDPRAAEPAEPT